jgi:hypothetical protein
MDNVRSRRWLGDAGAVARVHAAFSEAILLASLAENLEGHGPHVALEALEQHLTEPEARGAGAGGGNGGGGGGMPGAARNLLRKQPAFGEAVARLRAAGGAMHPKMAALRSALLGHFAAAPAGAPPAPLARAAAAPLRRRSAALPCPLLPPIKPPNPPPPRP